MARIVFIAPLFLGHFNPMAALALELARRGHHTVFMHMADGEALVSRRGVAFHRVGGDTHPAGFMAEMNRGIGRLNGAFGANRTIAQVASVTDMLCRELPGALSALQADIVICDQVEAAGGLAAEKLGLPHVSVASALPINWEIAAPPIYTSWRYDTSSWGRARNLAGYGAINYLLKPIGSVIEHWARTWSLGPKTRVDHCLSRLLHIGQLVPALDVPRERLWRVFHYCGALRSGDEAPLRALPPRDGRPLGYASLGSLQGARRDMFKRIATAARDADVQLVLSHAGGLSQAEADALPGRPTAYDFMLQSAVLSQASVAILHGGLNTVLDAAAHGVPIVVAPIAFEQGAIGMRVARSGMGVMLPRWRMTSASLRDAIRRLIDDRSFADAASKVRDEMAAAGGVQRAAQLIETVLRTGRPVRRRESFPQGNAA